MLGGGEVAQKVHASFHAHGTADGSGNVVVAGGAVAAQGAKHIQGRIVGEALDALNLGAHLIERHMAGAFDHALHAAFKGVFGKLAQIDDFFPLGGIARVHASAGAQAVAQRQGDVVGAADVEPAVKIFQQGIFAVILDHPAGKHGAATRNNAQHTVVFNGHFCAALGKAAVHGDKVHALLGLLGDFVKQGIGLHGGDVLLRVQNLLPHGVERYGSEGQRAGLEHAQAQRVQIARYGKIHHGIGPGFKGSLDLAFFGGRAVAQG